MKTSLAELLKPEILNSVSGLELTAKIIAEGFMTGSSRSQSVGAGQVFSQYRNYEPGDDLRQLDWKMYARSERYFVRQSDIETNITVKFILDASHSMLYEENKISKLQYSKLLIAVLAWLARKQRDTIGLYSVNENDISVVQPRFEQQQFMRFLAALIDTAAKGTWNKTTSINQVYDHHGKELILFFTDLYDEQQDLQQFITRLKTSRNEVIVFHLMGRMETNLGQKGTFTFQDLESGQRMEVNTLAEKEKYQARVSAWIADARHWMLEKQISYQLVIIDEPADEIIRNFLQVRKKLIR